MTTLYMLWHRYEPYPGKTEEKHIGVFSSEVRADEVADRLRGQSGFRDHPDGFQIQEVTVDRDNPADVYLLWHEPSIEEDEKYIGAYPSEAAINDARDRLLDHPEYRECPEGFQILCLSVDRDVAFAEGFVRTEPYDDLSLKYGDMIVGKVTMVHLIYSVDTTWHGDLERAIGPGDGGLAARVLKYIAFCEARNERVKNGSPAGPAASGDFADIVKPGLWRADTGLGPSFRIVGAPDFFPGSKVSWRAEETEPPRDSASDADHRL